MREVLIRGTRAFGSEPPMKRLRVLYLWNTAGALTPVADWLLDNGHEALILMSTQFDKFGGTSISRAASMVGSVSEYYREAIRLLITFRPTLVHVNTSLQSLLLARLIRPTTPIVFQYHGTEVRYRPAAHPEAALADRVLVSTPDLVQYGEWYDRPVSARFHYRGGRQPGTALMYYANSFMKDLRKEAQDWCDDRGIKLTMMVHGEHPGVPYAEMPDFLSQFEYFLDFKGYPSPKAISRLAVEAVACGCKVVSDTNPSHIIDDYEMANPERYYRLYTSIRRPSFSLRRVMIALVGLFKWMTGQLSVHPKGNDE
jgi:hypothetical protein